MENLFPYFLYHNFAAEKSLIIMNDNAQNRKEVSSPENTSQQESVLLSSGIVASFHKIARLKKTKLLTEAEWRQLEKHTKECLPMFFSTIKKENYLSRQERLTCILTRLGFSTKETAALLQTSIQRISNAKARANWKLFDEKKASTLRKNLLTIG